MTRTTITIVILSICFSLCSNIVHAAVHTATNVSEPAGKAIKSTAAAAQSETGHKVPLHTESHSQAPHGKTTIPHMEELPHIHKFHKERVKKIKKHHSKYWLLSQLILALCHISILVIGYLHATH